jgi:hypothetical protein
MSLLNAYNYTGKEKRNIKNLMQANQVLTIILAIFIGYFLLSLYIADRQEIIDIPVVGIDKDSTDWEDLRPRIEKHILLASDEEPTVAIVKDENKLREIDAEVYKNVRNGDILMVFTDKIIIYRSGEDVLIQASVLNDSSTPTE